MYTPPVNSLKGIQDFTSLGPNLATGVNYAAYRFAVESFAQGRDYALAHELICQSCEDENKRVLLEQTLESASRLPIGEFQKIIPQLIQLLIDTAPCTLRFKDAEGVLGQLALSLAETAEDRKAQLNRACELFLKFVERALQGKIVFDTQGSVINRSLVYEKLLKKNVVATLLLCTTSRLLSDTIQNPCVDFFIQILSLPLFRDANSPCNIYALICVLQFKASFNYYDLKNYPLQKALEHVLVANPCPVYLLAYAFHEGRRFQMNQSDRTPAPFPLSPESFEAVLQQINLASLDSFALKNVLVVFFQSRYQRTSLPQPLSPVELHYLVGWMEEMFRKKPNWLPSPLLLECPNFDQLWPMITDHLIAPQKGKSGFRFAALLAIFHPQLKLPAPFLNNLQKHTPHVPYDFLACTHHFPSEHLTTFKHSYPSLDLNNVLSHFVEGSKIHADDLFPLIELFNSLIRQGRLPRNVKVKNEKIPAILKEVADRLLENHQIAQFHHHPLNKILAWKLGYKTFLAFNETANYLLKDAQISPQDLVAHQHRMQQLSTIYLGTDSITNNIKI